MRRRVELFEGAQVVRKKETLLKLEGERWQVREPPRLWAGVCFIVTMLTTYNYSGVVRYLNVDYKNSTGCILLTTSI